MKANNAGKCPGHAGSQVVSYCPDCGPGGHRFALVRCPVHGIAECGPTLYPGSRCPKHEPPRRLTCCVCAASTVGRQWWNRDTGWGLCVPCADRLKAKETPAAMTQLYGRRGEHYDVPGAVQA